VGLLSLGRFSTFTLAGLVHFLSLKLRRRRISLRGACRQCGCCCRSVCLADSSGWVRSEKSFGKICEQFPEYQRFKISGKDSEGYLLFTCTWCSADGKCRDYGQRLDICRNYPENSLVFAGGVLPEECGFYFVENADFARILQREMRRGR